MLHNSEPTKSVNFSQIIHFLLGSDFASFSSYMFRQTLEHSGSAQALSAAVLQCGVDDAAFPALDVQSAQPHGHQPSPLEPGWHPEVHRNECPLHATTYCVN